MSRMDVTAFEFNVAAAREAGHLAGGVQPAFRAWADVLLQRGAAADHSPSIVMRGTAGVLSLTPSADAQEVTIDGQGCAVARRDAAKGLLSPGGWVRLLRDHLVDQGFDRDELEEHVLPCAAPLAPMHVTAAAGVVASTRTDLLQAISSYFAPEVDAYLISWGAAMSHPSDEVIGWELVVPVDR